MAILKDLIVHGSSRFLNKIYASEIQTPLIEAEAGIIKKLKADDVTVVGLLDVQGQMHTNSWTNSNIATIDGSFYITPTLSSSSGTVSFSSAAAATFTGTYSAVSSLYIGNNTASTVQWTSGSKILITGQVQVNGEWIPLGTLLGTLNSTNPTTSMPVVSITDNRNNTSNILTDIYSLKGNTSLSYRNLKVSLYQRADSSKYYPLGIFMTALGQNGKTFLDIYGGVNELTTSYGGYANPNVRIGNLSGLPAITTAAGNFTPVGWGIYTTNGYFSGTIVSNTGVIGGWKLGANSLFNGTTGLNNTTVGIYLGTDGIRNYKDTDTYVNITEGVITAKGVNLTGQINATAGNIGGATITGGTLTVPAANVSGQLTAATIDASKISTGDISSDRITTNVLTALQAKLTSLNTNNLSAITANLGTITTGVIKHDTVGGTNGIWLSADTDTSSNITVGESTARKDWRLLVNNKFGVTKTGDLYATSATISGSVTATSGSISGSIVTTGINADNITVGTLSADRIGANSIDASKINVSSINIGNLNGVSNYAQKIDVTQAINNIEIGGRNLIPLSKNLKSFTIENSTRVTVTYTDDSCTIVNTYGNTKYGIYYNVDVEPNSTYTLSFQASNISGTNINCAVGNRTPNQAASWTDITNGYKDIVGGKNICTFTIPDTVTVVRIYICTGSLNGTVTINNLKLEKGNKATDWTPAPEDTQESINSVSTVANTALSQSSWYATCPTPGGTTEKVATITPATTAFTLTEGATVNVKFDAKNTGAVGSITLNVNETGAKNIKYINNNAISNIPGTDYIAAGRTYQFVYDGTYWVIQNLNYNTNTNTIGTLGATKLIAGTNASNASATTVYRYTLIMKKTIGDSPTWVSLVTSSSTATSKTRYTGGLYPDKIFYMSTNVSSSPYGYSTGASTGDSYAALGFDLRYSTNCGSTLVIGKPVYLVGEINPLDGLFYLDSTWWTQTAPTMEDGKTYIYLGNAYSATNIYLVEKNPLMRYYRGAFRTEEQIAGMTATSYITYINANDGIKVHNESDMLNYLQLNSDAISMYRNRGDGINSDEVLRIDDTGIRVGKNNKAHFLLTNDKLAGYGDVGNVYFEVGKGDNTTIQLFYGNGERTGFEIGPLFKTIYYVKKNDITLTEGTDYEIDIVSTWYKIYFKTAPALNSTISVTYKDFYKSFIYTIGSSSSGDITVTSQQRPDGTMTMITIQTHKAYEAESIYRKKPGVDYWARLDLEGEQVSGTYRYSFYLDDEINTGDQIRIDYSTEKHSDLTPDTVTGNYIWDATYQNSTLLTIRSAIQILSVSVNNTVLTENQDYTLDGLLKYGRLIFYNAPAVNEKIEIKFAPEEYNFEYQPTYFNFSNTNLENSVKGIGTASFGSENVNKGIFCFIEGSNNIVTGYASHVEGSNNVAAGSNSHVGGSNSLVLGQNTFAYGDNLQATYLNSAAFGHYNSPDNQLFSIGKGGYENAFSINKDGNIQFGGRLLSGTTYENKIPLFKIIEKVYTGHGVGGNGGFSRARDITIAGYKPIAILGFSVTNMPGHPTSTEADASWCVVPRIWIGYDYTYDHQNYKTDSLYYYFWNLNTSKRVNVQIGVKILYIAKSAYPDFSQQEEEA